jgi:hypothetical protein
MFGSEKGGTTAVNFGFKDNATAHKGDRAAGFLNSPNPPAWAARRSAAAPVLNRIVTGSSFWAGYKSIVRHQPSGGLRCFTPPQNPPQ